MKITFLCLKCEKPYLVYECSNKGITKNFINKVHKKLQSVNKIIGNGYCGSCLTKRRNK